MVRASDKSDSQSISNQEMKTTSTAPVLLLFFTKDDGETPSPLPSTLASVTMLAEIREQKSSLSTQNWRRCARSYKKVRQ